MRFIVVTGSGQNRMYQTPRRNTGVMYQDRTSWSLSLADARIFQTRAAATNSAKKSGIKTFEVLPVEITVIETAPSIQSKGG